MTETPNLRRLIGRISELPVLPSVLVELLVLDPQADSYPDQVTELISIDPGFSLRVLRAANSADSAPIAPIVSISAAIARIGTVRAARLVLAGGVVRAFVPRDAWERSLWLHALQVGAMSRELAHANPSLGVAPEHAYAAGLLHDVGRFIMFQEAPEQLRDIDEGEWGDAAGLLEIERSVCGIDHCQVGAMACERWGLPIPLIAAVELHHGTPGEPHSTDPLVKVVRAADLSMFPSSIPGQPSFAERSDAEVDATLIPSLPAGIDHDARSLRRLIDQAVIEADAAARHLHLAGDL